MKGAVFLMMGILIFSVLGTAAQAQAQFSFQARPTSINNIRFLLIPDVSVLSPTEGEQFDQNEQVALQADVKSFVPLSSVIAEVTYPDLTTQNLLMVESGGTWTTSFSSAQAGSHTIKVEAKTILLSKGSATVTIQVDDITPPVTTDDVPTVWAQPTSATLSCTDDYLGCTQTVYCTTSPTCTPTTVYASPIPLTESITTLRYHSTDVDGNVETTKTTAVMIDATPPSTSTDLSGSLGLGSWYDSDVQITLECSDSLSGCSQTLYCIDQTDSCTPSTVYTDVFSVSDGIWFVRYSSIDHANNIESETSIQLSVDTTEPTVSSVVVSPDPTNVNPTVTATGTDTTGTLIAAEYTIDNPITVPSFPMTASDESFDSSSEAIEGIIQLSSVPQPLEGLHTVYVRVRDEAGNWGDFFLASDTFVVDISAPTTTADLSGTEGSGEWYLSDVTVTLSPSDTISGVSLTEYCVDQTDTCTPSTSGTSILVSSEGISYVRFRSIDEAGNIESVQSVTVQIDSVDPTTTDDFIGGLQNVAVTITLIPSDPVPSSGLSDTLYCVDQTDTCTPSTSGTSTTIGDDEDDGTHYLRYHSFDNAGNIQSIQSKQVILDTVAPTLTLDSPSGIHIITGSTPTGDVDYIVKGSETLTSADYQVEDDVGSLIDQGPLTYNAGLDQWESLAGSHLSLVRGDYTIIFNGEDMAGNPADPAEADFTIFLEATCIGGTDGSDCNTKLDGTYDQVTLTTSITNCAGTCITFGADNIVFDGGWDQGVMIEADTIFTFPDTGIDLNGRSNVYVQNSDISGFVDFGVDTNGAISSTIKNNIIHHTATGLWVDGGSSSTISNNIIEWSDLDGIVIFSSDSNSLNNNIIRFNSNNGIAVIGDTNTIEDNTIDTNGDDVVDYGVKIISGTGNVIFHNNFLNNFDQASEGGTSFWDDGSEGNFWDDHTCTSPVSGICGNPYTTSGGGLDSFPFEFQDGWI